MSDKLKVYCETSFWSYLTGRQSSDEKIARCQAFTLKWWEDIAPHCEIYVSQHVKSEAAEGNPSSAVRRQQVMVDALDLDGYIDEIRVLAKSLLSAHAVPETEPTDALHIATATIYQMDALLTWNCKHMANPVALPKTISTIARSGYRSPVIITPEDFLSRKEEFGL